MKAVAHRIRRAFVRCYFGTMPNNKAMSTRSNVHTNIPLTSDQLARPAGIASMFRMPIQNDARDLDACFVGVPFDAGTSYRPGSRLGPRQIRHESVYIRHHNLATGAAPYESLRVADCGDINMNIYNIQKAMIDIRNRISQLISSGCKPIAMGGDHTISYPILQSIKEKYGAVGLIHVDAHDDTAPSMGGEEIAHGTPFYCATEDGCLDTKRVIQIGLRGTGYGPHEYDYGKIKGFRIVPADECWHKSLTPLMAEVREMMGNKPVYLSFDIDAIDPGFAPGTGIPEIGGLTPIQSLEIIRGCRGLNIVGCDLVEVSPPLDQSGRTALLAANLIFEMLCVLPGVVYKKRVMDSTQ